MSDVIAILKAIPDLVKFLDSIDGEEQWDCLSSEADEQIAKINERNKDIFPQGMYEIKKFLEVCRDNNINFRIKAYHTFPHWTWYYQAIY